MDVTEPLSDFTFGFKYQEGTPVDMLDNNFIKLKLKYEDRHNYLSSEIDNIGLHDCTETTFMNDVYKDTRELTRLFGRFYCPNEPWGY